jgi:hypothetical protein
MSMRKPTRKNELATGEKGAVKKLRPAKKQAAQPAPSDAPIEADPAVERGERIQTGKAIARGGGGDAPVKGATPDTKQPKSQRK